MQQNRIKQTSQTIKSIFRTKMKHSKKIKELEKQLTQKTQENDKFIGDAEEWLDTLNSIKKQVEQNYDRYTRLMTSRDKYLSDCIAVQDQMTHLQTALNLEKNHFSQCQKLLTKYRSFTQDTKRVGQTINQLLQAKFDEFESKWFEWDEKEVLFWFKYKLEWFQASINGQVKKNNNMEMKEDSKEQQLENEVLSIDFDKILTNLESRQARGKFMSVLDTADLDNVGFALMKHQLIVYNAIQNLVVKYPIPKVKLDLTDDEIYGQVTCEHDKTTNSKEIDQKYLCPLSKQVMRDPVIASDGVTYERSALAVYVRKHHKLPHDDMIIDDIDQEIQDLFVDENLKQEIEN